MPKTLSLSYSLEESMREMVGIILNGESIAHAGDRAREMLASSEENSRLSSLAQRLVVNLRASASVGATHLARPT